MVHERGYIIEFCRNKEIYIYGAGKIGKECRCFLVDNGVMPVCHVVTQIVDNAQNDVVELESVTHKENAGFIIAGSISNSYEMHSELVKKGITNYVFFNPAIEDNIRRTVDYVEKFDNKRLGLCCDGNIAKAVIDRGISADYKLIKLFDDKTDMLNEYTIEEAVGLGVRSIMIIADTPYRTADLFLRVSNELKNSDIPIYDKAGKELRLDLYSDIRNNKECTKIRVLMIDEYIPQYDKSAGNRLTYFYLLCYIKLGCSVWFLPLDTTSNGYEKGIEEQGVHVIHGEMYGKLWLVANGGMFDMVFLHRPECAEYYLDTIKKYCKKARIIYHPADLHYIRLQRQYELTGDPSLKNQAEKYKRIETKAINDSDFIYVVGSKEKQLVEELSSGKLVRDIPIYLYDANSIPDRKPACERVDILFVGSFRHAPNVDAVEWLAKEILPSICNCFPEIKCHVVGGNVPESLLKLANDNLVFEGYVSDKKLREMYLGCRLSIAPLRFGAGIKGKIIEAAYHGLPVVTTFVGAEGVHDAEKFITVADTAENFAEEIASLYEDFERIDAIAESTKEVIADNYTSKVAEDILRADLKKEITD